MVIMLTGLKRRGTRSSWNSGQEFFEKPSANLLFRVCPRWATEAFFKSMLLHKVYHFSFVPLPTISISCHSHSISRL
jgi:hypothetical protein